MGLRDEIEAYYIDGYNLVTPMQYRPGMPKQGSDNGPMFTSEYHVLLKDRGESDVLDAIRYSWLIQWCLNDDGSLNRVPHTALDRTQAPPDDYYAIANASLQLGITHLTRGFLRCLIRNKGCLNNVNPGQWSWQSFLIRQPQLLCALITASFPGIKGLPIRLLTFPLYLYSALVIATSCITAPTTDADSRRLSWHLVRTLAPNSILCYLASKVWWARLKKDYPGQYPMREVAMVYYQPKGIHPFSKYWVK